MKSNKIKFLVNDKFFDKQKDAELYALEMTNPISSKVWINMVVFYNETDYYCVKSYTLT